MLQPSPRGRVVLPTWLVVLGSAAIVCHFAGLAISVLDAPSGPWPSQGGPSIAEPPHFARASSSLGTAQGKYLRVAHSFHFDSNRPADASGVQFEVRLKDADGKLLKTLRFPDPAANPWVRHRQEILARSLAPDLPVPPQEAEVLAAPGAAAPTTPVWLLENERVDKVGMPPMPPAGRLAVLRLQTVPTHLVPRNRDVWRPSDWALLLVRSYCRYLCRTHDAASAEVVRHSRNSVPPAVLFGNKATPEEPNSPYHMVFEDLVAHFEEVSR